jgi:sterol desaturase/sphingolipid hydroxylase (fatty acid hydroxylase superfamily)
MDFFTTILEDQFNQFASTFDILEILGLAFLFAVVSETVWDYITGERKKLGETLANFCIGLVGSLLERTAYGLILIVALAFATPFALWEIPHTWWSWILSVIIADLTYYWMHRFEHEIRFLWAHHSVHHSSSEFNFTTALRLAWTEALFEWIFFIPMILMGFSLVQTIIALLIVVGYQSWIHTEKIGKLGWMDGVFNTPSVHRVHHGSNRRYLDKNYGGILIIWDRIFGTYEPETEKVVYGLTKAIGTVNPIKVSFYEYTEIYKDLKKAKSFKEVYGYLFKRPGWRPNTKKRNI